MKNYSLQFNLFLFCTFVFLIFFSTPTTYANGYQKVAPGGTVTIGEFVFDDNFVATTTDCWVGITDPLGTVMVASTTLMTANSDGWHYYSYTTPGNSTDGIWPSTMSCGTAQNGDLIIVDKSFVVDSSIVSTSSIKNVVDESLTVATSSLIAEIQKGWTVTLSDFEGTTVNTAYKAKLQVLNYAAVPTDADSLPTVVITDPAGTIQVPSGTMTKDSDGTYSYSYSIGSSSIGGVWETEVYTVVNGETIRLNDYWNLSSSPADVQIIEITDKTTPTITADVRIDNMGAAGSDFYYVYCIVNSADNLCGGNDDIDSGSDTAYINAGSFINLSLTLDEVLTPGTYWFKVKARALAETLWAASTEQFIAESADTSGGGGGGGGGGGSKPPSDTTCTGADFNHDGRVNSIDFSILLAFWQKQPPFANPCVDINKDSKVDSVDFSILLYEWNN